KDVVKHFLMAFSVLGTPKAVKMDNGPASTSSHLWEFFQQWGITHTTGIPHSPTGQAIIERAHRT
ncbi:POK6 protein, partial [Drymodes brunneopygia]|nr:POK6 protein [Drymodes brunneopygia]